MRRALVQLGALAIAVYLLVGSWIASSIAAYLGLPRLVVVSAAALALVLLPLLWEAWAPTPRRPPRLGFFGRWLVRALVANTVLVGGVLGWAADDAFAALSTRGDWVLDGQSGAFADRARSLLFGSVDLLARAHHQLRDNPFAGMVTEQAPPPSTRSTDLDPTAVRTDTDPVPKRTVAVRFARPDGGTSTDGGVGPDAGAEAGDGGVTLDAGPIDGSAIDAAPLDATPAAESTPAVTWPLPAVLHPAVARVRPADEANLTELARQLTAEEADPVQRVKALHDWVAANIAYDVEAWSKGQYPPQDAETVLARRTGVCAGYANLLAALGRAVGIELSVVIGDARVAGRSLEGTGHAWNVVRLGERHHLIDVTWDAGSVQGGRFEKRYSTAYFLVPPEIMADSHLPRDPAWQLLTQPLTAGDFYRRPMMQPSFHALGLALVSPQRSQVETDDAVELVVDNPRGRWVMGRWGLKAAGGAASVPTAECRVEGRERLTITCPLDTAGTHRVQLFGSTVQYGTYEYLGELEVNRR